MTSVLTIENIYEDKEFTKLSSVTMRILETQCLLKNYLRVIWGQNSTVLKIKKSSSTDQVRIVQRNHKNSVSFIVPGAYAGAPLGSWPYLDN